MVIIRCLNGTQKHKAIHGKITKKNNKWSCKIVMMPPRFCFPYPCLLTPHHSNLPSIMFPKKIILNSPLKPPPLFFKKRCATFTVRGAHTRWRSTRRMRNALGARPQCKIATGAAHTQRAMHKLISPKCTKLPKKFCEQPSRLDEVAQLPSSLVFKLEGECYYDDHEIKCKSVKSKTKMI